MKKIIVISLMILLNGLSFSYTETAAGLYTFNNDEARELFGPNKACQYAATTIINSAILKTSIKKKTTQHDDATEELKKMVEITNRLVVEEEDFDSAKAAKKKTDFDRKFTNILYFYQTTCPRMYEADVKKLFPPATRRVRTQLGVGGFLNWKYYEVMRDNKIKPKSSDKMDKYGVRYQYDCDFIVTETYMDGSVRKEQVCGYRRAKEYWGMYILYTDPTLY